MSGTSSDPNCCSGSAMVNNIPRLQRRRNQRSVGTADSNSFTMYGYLNGVDALNTSYPPSVACDSRAESVIYFSSNYGDTAARCDRSGKNLSHNPVRRPVQPSARESHLERRVGSTLPQNRYMELEFHHLQPTTLYAWNTEPTWSSNGDPYNLHAMLSWESSNCPNN